MSIYKCHISFLNGDDYDVTKLLIVTKSASLYVLIRSGVHSHPHLTLSYITPRYSPKTGGIIYDVADQGNKPEKTQ